jgi:D-lactate dehydrogenase
MVDGPAIAQMRRGVMIVNTSRGALVDTQALIDGLKNGTIAHLGLDVYEEEEALFFQDLYERRRAGNELVSTITDLRA